MRTKLINPMHHTKFLARPQIPGSLTKALDHSIDLFKSFFIPKISAPASGEVKGRCPFGFDQPLKKSGSAFIDKAAKEASEAEIATGDPLAQAALDATRAAIYHWPETFPGFRADLEISNGGSIHRGHMQARGSRDYQIEVKGFEPEGWLRFQIEEFLAHREHPNVSKMASRSGVVFGDDDTIYGRRVDFVNDPMESFYRLKDNKITQIGRNYSKQKFIITIDSHHDCGGSFAATFYTAYYRDQLTGKLERTEAFHDRYVELDGLHLPAMRRYVQVNGKGMIAREIKFKNLELLP